MPEELGDPARGPDRDVAVLVRGGSDEHPAVLARDVEVTHALVAAALQLLRDPDDPGEQLEPFLVVFAGECPER